MTPLARSPLGRFTAWVVFAVFLATLLPPSASHGALRKSAIAAGATPEQAQQRLRDAFARLRSARDRVSAAEVDVKARAKALGRDVDKIFAFVRDEVGHEVYAGVLRGADGALLGRAGNAADKSLLLHALLTANGVSARFATGTLDESRARELVDQMLRRARPVTPPSVAEDTVARSLRDSSHLSSAQLAGYRAKRKDTQDLLRQVDEDQRFLDRVLRESSVRLEGGAPAASATLVSEARPHVWVQYQRGGAWVDLDPSFSRARSGEAFARPTATPATIPDALHHRVAIRVKMEAQRDGGLHVSTLLEAAYSSAHLVGTHLLLGNVPNFPAAKPGLAALDQASKFLPMLMVRGTRVFREGFDLRGNVVPSAEFTPGLAGATGGAFGGFGRALGGLSPETASGELTRVWLELAVQAPGTGERTYVRDVVDRIGPEHRAKPGPKVIKPEYADESRLRHLLAGQYTIAVDTGFYCRPSAFHTIAAQLAARQPLAEAAVKAELANDDAAKDQVAAKYAEAAAQDLSAELVALSCGTKQLGDRLVAGRYAGAVFYRAGPGIALLTTRLDRVPNSSPVVHRGFDIVAQPLRAMAAPAAGDPRAIVLALGVLQTHLEGLLAADFHDALVEQLDAVAGAVPVQGAREPLTTVDVFEAAQRTGVRSILLGQQNAASALPRLGLPPGVRARIGEEIARGNIVLVPERAVPLRARPTAGWWRIDPASGSTLGIMESGEGAAIAEYVVPVSRALPAAMWLMQHRFAIGLTLTSACLGGLFLAIATGLAYEAGIGSAGDAQLGALVGGVACAVWGAWETMMAAVPPGGGQASQPGRPAAGPPGKAPPAKGPPGAGKPGPPPAPKPGPGGGGSGKTDVDKLMEEHPGLARKTAEASLTRQDSAAKGKSKKGADVTVTGTTRSQRPATLVVDESEVSVTGSVKSLRGRLTEEASQLEKTGTRHESEIVMQVGRKGADPPTDDEIRHAWNKLKAGGGDIDFDKTRIRLFNADGDEIVNEVFVFPQAPPPPAQLPSPPAAPPAPPSAPPKP
jgi:transglutaminase-like putative cysteine protease